MLYLPKTSQTGVFSNISSLHPDHKKSPDHLAGAFKVLYPTFA